MKIKKKLKWYLYVPEKAIIKGQNNKDKNDDIYSPSIYPYHVYSNQLCPATSAVILEIKYKCKFPFIYTRVIYLYIFKIKMDNNTTLIIKQMRI